MITIVVEDFRYIGKYGGAIFAGRCIECKRKWYVADYKVMPRAPIKGEVWSLRAEKENHPKFGLQFVVSKAVLQRPSGCLIIKAIAKSYLFPDIGEKTVDKLFRRYGEKLYDMLDAGDPKLFEKPLKSKVKAQTIVDGWRELSIEVSVYKWLDIHGVPVWLTQKIISLYGDEAIQKLEENTYRLQTLTNWETAERIRKIIGISDDDDRRLIAAVDQAVFKRLTSDRHDQIGKHTWTETKKFEKLVNAVLDGGMAMARKAIKVALDRNAIIEIGGGIQGIGPASMEKYIADSLRTMNADLYHATQKKLRIEPDEAFMKGFFRDYQVASHISLNEEQCDAVTKAVTKPAIIICGGSGVGKTTVLKAVCAANEKIDRQIHMMALSDRAARRIKDATGREAMTIDSFISKVDREDIVLLDTEATIAVDEANMLSLSTMYRLLRRLEPGCRLLLIGDSDQLPPISFGVVFHTLVECKTLPMVELTEVHSQAAATGIPAISQAIREGRDFSFHPELSRFKGPDVGVSFIESEVDDIPVKLLKIMDDFGEFKDARILTPVKRGVAGVLNTNKMFHIELAAGKVPDLHGFGEGEPVIWTEDDYDLDLMNGTLGTILDVTKDGLNIDWDNGAQHITDLKHLEWAYAIKVHTSQGNQFERSVVPVFENALLDRTLLYTAVTRSLEQVVLIGDREAMKKAVMEPPSASVRETGLQFYL